MTRIDKVGVTGSDYHNQNNTTVTIMATPPTTTTTITTTRKAVISLTVKTHENFPELSAVEYLYLVIMIIMTQRTRQGTRHAMYAEIRKRYIYLLALSMGSIQASCHGAK